MKIFLLLMAVLAGAYALLLSKPELYFSDSLSYKGFTLRWRGAAPSGVEPALDAALQKLSTAELYREGMPFELVLASGGEFGFFTPLQKGEYYRVSPFRGVIYLAAADFGAGEARPASGGEARLLSVQLAGAAARALVRKNMEPLSYIFMGDWEARGYAERVSGGLGRFAPADTCSDGSDPALQDYKYGLMLDLMMREYELGFKQLLDRRVSREAAEGRLKKTYCGG